MPVERKFIYCCLGLLIFLSSRPAVAGENVLDVVYFKKIFTEVVKKNAPWPAEDLVVENFSTRPEELVLPEGPLSYVLQSPMHPKYLGRKVVDVQMLVNGQEAAEIKMTGDLQLYGEVVCLKQNLSRHAVLAASDVELVRRNITALGADLISAVDDAIGQRLRSSLRAGSVLSAYYLEPTPLVERGDLVTIMAQSDHFTITAPGEVRGTAAKGEMVKVKNLMSRKEIFARVISPETVEIDL